MNKVYVNGKVYVRRRRCDTCVFRPGNLMHLDEGRLDGMISGADANGSCIPCHHHLHQGADIEPVCRGYYDRHSSMTLRLAEAMEIIEFVGESGDTGDRVTP